MEIIVTAFCSLLGVLLGSGIIQFFVNRKDKKAEDLKNDKYEELRKEFQKELNEREGTGELRHKESKTIIEQMNVAYQKDFKELKDAIIKLTDNDTKITDSIQKMSDKQELMAESLLGLSHDKIISTTDKIAMRGAITIKEQATLDSMYKPYSSLGGNGHCKKAMEYVAKLSVVSDEEARRRDAELRLGS